MYVAVRPSSLCECFYEANAGRILAAEKIEQNIDLLIMGLKATGGETHPLPSAHCTDEQASKGNRNLDFPHVTPKP